MTANFHRVAFAAISLPLVAMGIFPANASAQLPRIEAISAADDAICRCGFVQEEQPGLSEIVYLDEPARHGIFRFFQEGEWYFSWGASRQTWSPTNIHISQPSLGNSFAIYGVRGVDDGTWTSLFGGQYNVRFGRFIDEARTLAVELNFDHTKYATVIGQSARVAGTINGKPTDSTVRLDEQFLTYKMHNGANHIMVNLVKRVPLIGQPNESWSVAAIGKFGFGIMLPHSENIVMGKSNDVGNKEFGNLFGTKRGWWQLDGWTTGIEVGFRFGLTKHLYLELTDKVAYASFSDIPVFQGTARNNIWMNEVVLSLGVTFGAR